MDANRVFSNVQGGGGGGGMFGLDIPLHNRHQTSGNGTPPPQLQMVTFSTDINPIRQQQQQQSDDEEEESNKRKAGSQWHRMKWTDTMVKLLIMAVYYIGDEAGTDGQKNIKPATSGASAGAGGGLQQQQKKGKWKSVSRAMMEKGYCVSPQQCEDKFNDLNKRYKRVNDILGRGTACRVVEDQTLLESMDHLSPKLKEEARKLLNSKHLFFREMCAYHSSCSSASASHHHHQSAMEKPTGCNSHKEEEEQEEEEEEYDSGGEWEEEEEEEERGEGRKKGRVEEEIKGEVNGVMGDGSKTAAEKRRWLAGRMVEVEEAGVRYQMEALEMEKQRWKWARYCRNKEMEMEKKKMEIERRRLENQRMMLLLRHKELSLYN